MTHSMPSRDVNATTRLAEASWRRDNVSNEGGYKSTGTSYNFDKNEAVHNNDLIYNTASN